MMSSSFVSEGDAVQGKFKKESEPEVHKPLKKVKARATVDGSNGELSIVLRESSKSDNVHGPSMCGVTPIASNQVIGGILMEQLLQVLLEETMGKLQEVLY